MPDPSTPTAVAEPHATPEHHATSEHKPGALRHHRVEKKDDAHAAASVKRKRGPLFWIIVAALIVGGGIWVARFVEREINYEETDDAFVTGHVHQISSRIAGTVGEVLVTDNEVVKARQPLATMDALEYEISLQKAQATLLRARADEAQMKAAIAQAQADAAQAKAQVAQAEAQVQETEAQLAVANVNLNRNTRLFQNDARAVAKADVDTTRSTADATSASLLAAKANVEAARAKALSKAAAAESAEAQWAAAKASVAAQEAAVRDAEREMSYATIYASTDGRIGNKNVEVGNRVQIGQALFALVEPEVWIVANFKETQLRKMRAGQPVELTVDALGSRVFTGKVESISPASGAEFALLPADNATGNFTKVVQRVPVKIVFDPESIRGFEDRLRPGFSTVVSVRVK
jgi:membrane fusion protein (multidrug efflux system)